MLGPLYTKRSLQSTTEIQHNSMLIIALFYFPLNFHNPVLQRAQTNNNFAAYKDTACN